MSWLLPKTNWVYIHIPKTGGTSIRHSLQKAHYILNKFEVDPNKVQEVFGVNKAINPTHIKINEYPLIGMDYKKYNYFTQVRNPFHRLVSAYFFLIQQDLDKLNGNVKQENLKRDLDFYRQRRKKYMKMKFKGFVELFLNKDAKQEFIDEWIVERTSQLKYCWTLQHEWIRDCPTELKVFKLEDPDKINEWLADLNFKYNYVHRKNQEIKDYAQYYDSVLEKKVYRYFQDDFFHYEYSRYVPK